MIKTIIFDFDGVIVESVDIKTKAFAQLFEDKGSDIVTAVVDYHLKHAGVSRFDKFRYIYREIIEAHLDEKTYAFLCQRFSELVEKEVKNAPYVAGAREFFAKYADRYTCFICSATPFEELQRIIKEKGAEQFFKKIYGAPMSKINIVKEIIDHNTLRPTECVYVGDAMSDYEAAKVNRVQFIARIQNNERFFESISCIRIPDLKNLHATIDKLGFIEI